jgi:ATP-dependent DNA helicase RecG
MHRDYSITGMQVSVEVYDDRVEIVNPGGLPKGLSVRNLGTVSIRRNELISDLFFRLHKVERIGMGIQKMKEAMVAAGLHEPTFASDAFFRATFQRSPEFALKEGTLGAEVSEKKPEGKAAQKTIQKTTQKTAQKVMGLIRHNPEITRRELAIEIRAREPIDWADVDAKKRFGFECLSPGAYAFMIPASSYKGSVGAPLPDQIECGNLSVEIAFQGGDGQYAVGGFSVNESCWKA